MFPAISSLMGAFFADPPGEGEDRTKNVPDRVMVAAFRYLSIEGLGSAARVNKKWNGCVGFNNDELWKQVKLDYPLLTTVDEREWRKLDCNALGLDPSGAPQITDKATLRAVVTWMKGVFRGSHGNFPVVIDLTFPKGYGNENCGADKFETSLKKQKEIGNGKKPITPETLKTLISVTYYNLPETSWVLTQTERVFVACRGFSFEDFLKNCPSGLSQMQPAGYVGVQSSYGKPIIGYQRLQNGQRLDYIRRPDNVPSSHCFLRLAEDTHTLFPEDWVEMPEDESIFKPKERG